MFSGRYIHRGKRILQQLPVSVLWADASVPEHWLRFLLKLLEPEDIPALQEPRLLPDSIHQGQKMLILIGKGKSRISVIMNAIFGLNINATFIQKVENNCFARADLEGMLPMVGNVIWT